MKKLLLIAVFSGFILGLAWPTYGISFLSFFGFVPLLFTEYKIRNASFKRKKGSVFLSAYIAFLIWNLIATWWIYNATGFGMIFAVLVNSLLMSFVFLLYHIIATKFPNKISLIFLPSIWIAFEKFHLNWDFSWPWLNLGNVFSNSTAWIQWYEYTGSFGGSLWVWMINIILFKTLVKYNNTKSFKAIQKNIVYALLCIAIPIAISIAITPTINNTAATTEVVVLQPNVDPYSEKYNTTNKLVAQNLVALSKTVTTPKTQLIVAPETVFANNFKIEEYNQSYALYILRQYLKDLPEASFLAGVSLVKIIKDKNKVGPQTNYFNDKTWFNDYNSAFMINGFNNESELYHKSKLVVGVENFPFKPILEPILGNVMLDLGGTIATKTTQDERSVMHFNQQTTAPIICYESVYGEYVSEYVANGAQLLTIITNDAWWGNTPGHRQHLSYAKLRAIETRRYVARSANTGISAFINPTGTIEQQLEYGKKGALKGNIALLNEKTFYVKYGDYLARIAILLAGGIFIFSVAKKKESL